MKCQQASIYLSPYLDSALDRTTTYEVSRHLEGCPRCAKLFMAEEELERAIRERLGRPSGDEEQIVERALLRAIPGHGRSVGLRLLLLAAASLLVLSGPFAYRLMTRGSMDVPEIIAMVAEDHRGYLIGEIQPDLLTENPADVASFFRGQLDGAIGALPIGDGWEIEGARVCRFRDTNVAFVTLRYHGIPVSVVDVPYEEEGRTLSRDLGLGASARCFELAGGRGILRRTSTGFRAAFGDVEAAKLSEVIAAAR